MIDYSRAFNELYGPKPIERKNKMNERIKELAIQVQRTEMPGVLFAHPEFVEKFAELIVRECIEQASIDNGYGNNLWDRALTFAAKNIREHFGVEE